MTPEQDILGQEVQGSDIDPIDIQEVQGQTEMTVNPPDAPSVGPKSGWKTSEGQMTFLFTIAALVLSYFKINMSSDQIHNGYDLVMSVIGQLGPMFAAGMALWQYIKSRGKLKSNSVNATAALMGAHGMVGGPWGSLIKVGKVIGSSGIIPGPAGKIASDILGDDMDTNYQGLYSVVKNHEGRIRTLESK
jgi:hypothetical protein